MKKRIKKAGSCLVSKRLYQKRGRLKWAFHEPAKHANDSGWRFLAAEDTTKSLASKSALMICDMNTMIKLEPLVAGIYWYPVGADLRLDWRPKKQFVYEDTGEVAILSDSIETLPFSDPAFRTHFPAFIKNYEAEIEQQLAINEADLEALRHLEAQVEQLVNVLFGTRVDQPKAYEVEILLGVLQGYLAHLGATEDFAPTMYERFLTSYLTQRFNQPYTVVKAAYDRFAKDTAKDPWAEHLLALGEWFTLGMALDLMEEMNRAYRLQVRKEQKKEWQQPREDTYLAEED